MDEGLPQRPIRILHVLAAMNVGGVETWLMHVLRHIDRRRFRMDFLVHTEKPGDYDDEIRGLGSRVLSCPGIRQWHYGVRLRRLIRTEGPYDIVHSHVHHFSGHALRCANQVGVPVRIAHSHNVTAEVEQRAGWLRRRYLGVMARWIQRHATSGLACSDAAAADLFGSAWRSDQRFRVLYYGIDMEPFRHALKRHEARKRLGLPEGAFVVGHVGRMAPPKNHLFLLDVFRAIADRRDDAHVLLVGDGALRADIEHIISRLGLQGRAHLVGVRTDVARCMDAMDVFLFPSLHEGLGLVLVEAQAAGIPCVVSDVVPTEADLIPGLVQRLALSAPVNTWSDLVVNTARRAPLPQAQALAIAEGSAFNIERSVQSLCAIYAS